MPDDSMVVAEFYEGDERNPKWVHYTVSVQVQGGGHTTVLVEQAWNDYGATEETATRVEIIPMGLEAARSMRDALVKAVALAEEKEGQHEPQDAASGA